MRRDNHIGPPPGRNIADLPLDESSLRRNFQMHIWPSMTGAWRWNCDQVLARAELFNGRRVVAIAVDPQAEHPYEVREYLRDFTDHFIEIPNHPKLREVATFVPLLEANQSINANEITFCCHSKGSRHATNEEDPNSTIYRWTEAMYETCLDYPDTVRRALLTNGMAGSFRRLGQFTTPGNHRWHYSGTFYWFRNADVYSRNWRKVDQFFFGTESWPGLMFRVDEVACLFMDRCQDLYQLKYWTDTVQPELERWRNERAVQATQDPGALADSQRVHTRGVPTTHSR